VEEPRLVCVYGGKARPDAISTTYRRACTVFGGVTLGPLGQPWKDLWDARRLALALCDGCGCWRRALVWYYSRGDWYGGMPGADEQARGSPCRDGRQRREGQGLQHG